MCLWGLGGLKSREDWANRLVILGKESGFEERLKGRKEGEALESRSESLSISYAPLTSAPSRPDAAQEIAEEIHPVCLCVSRKPIMTVLPLNQSSPLPKTLPLPCLFLTYPHPSPCLPTAASSTGWK